MRPDYLDPLVVGAVGAQQCLHRQCARDVGGRDQKLGVVHGERQQCLHRLRAVDQRQAFLRRQHQRLDPVLGEHLRGRAAAADLASEPQPALADQRLGEVGELRQVPRRADGALARDHRQQAQAQHLDQPGGQVGPDPGVAGGERPGPEEQYGAHGLVVQRLPDPGRVGHDDRTLECREILLAHPGVGQCTEARVDAVDGVRAVYSGGNHLTAGPHPGRHAGAQLGPRPPECDIHDIIDGERVAADDHCSHV
jgi:hypothetical protein